jgi:transposase
VSLLDHRLRLTYARDPEDLDRQARHLEQATRDIEKALDANPLLRFTVDYATIAAVERDKVRRMASELSDDRDYLVRP